MMTGKVTKPALLMLEDGRSFRGRAWGAEGEACGEMVFNTAMSGYQEVLTDPSYAGQIVCMTYPLIGNYGVNRADEESARPWVEGFVVREASRTASNWRSEETLDLDEKSLLEKTLQSPPMENRQLANVVTTPAPYEVAAEGPERFHVVCYD